MSEGKINESVEDADKVGEPVGSSQERGEWPDNAEAESRAGEGHKPVADEQDGVEAAAASTDPKTGEAPRKKSRWKKIGVVAVVVIIVAIAAGTFAAFATGKLYPNGAAAKYGLFSYVEESEVTDYIENYKTQMGYGDASDEDWATFLAAYNLTPERLRASTIDQLVTDKIAEKKCSDLGIAVSDDELNQAVDYYKNLYAYGNDDTWQQTLSQYGQTEEGFRESQRLSILKQKLAENQVPQPTPSDDEVKSTIASYIDNANANDTSLTLKHSYCFKKKKSSSEGSLDELNEVQKIRDELVKVGATEESFASVVSLYSDDEDELKQKAGANGWNADTTGYGEAYIKALDNTGKGGVSSVFADDDYYYFIWVSDTYTLPKKSAKATDIDLSKMPDALHQYFSDVAAYAQWQQDSQEYLANLTSDINVVFFAMPSDVPYNVDMSLAQTSSDDPASGSSSSDGDSASGSDGGSSSSDGSADTGDEGSASADGGN